VVNVYVVVTVRMGSWKETAGVPGMATPLSENVKVPVGAAPAREPLIDVYGETVCPSEGVPVPHPMEPRLGSAWLTGTDTAGLVLGA
jgi:hypothetical protein